MPLFNRLRTFLAGHPEDTGLAPATPLAVIGDVHGCADLLDRLLVRIAHESPQAQVVLVGDLIDRGPDSAAVLKRARALDAVTLRGNHEQMMIDFLDAPGRNGTRWRRHGGVQTLASFGLDTISSETELRDALRAAMPAGLEDWLRALPLHFVSGNIAVTHAGADPRKPLAAQTARDLLWGHPGFGRRDRHDGLRIVHGHTIVGRPRYARGVISVDTGAYQSGRLSAALVYAGDLRFVTEEK